MKWATQFLYLQVSLILCTILVVVESPADLNKTNQKAYWEERIAFAKDPKVMMALSGFLPVDDMIILRETYKSSHCRIHLDIALARALVRDRRYAEAMSLLETLSDRECDVAEFNDLRYAYYTPGRNLLSTGMPTEGLCVLHATSLSHRPNLERENVMLLKATILLETGNPASAQDLLNKLIASRPPEEYIEGDQNLMRRTEGNILESDVFGQDDLNLHFDENFNPKPPPVARFLFRSSIAARHLGTPCSIRRPWRDARLVLAECLAAQGKWQEAAEHIDFWLSKYSQFYSFEEAIEASARRVELLQKADRYEESGKEQERGLRLCEEYLRYLERDNICFKPNPKFGLPEIEPAALMLKIGRYVESMKVKFSCSSPNERYANTPGNAHKVVGEKKASKNQGAGILVVHEDMRKTHLEGTGECGVADVRQGKVPTLGAGSTFAIIGVIAGSCLAILLCIQLRRKSHPTR